LETAITASKIAALSSGEFVGIVADDPDCKIELKSFQAGIQNNHATLKKEQEGYKPEYAFVHKNNLCIIFYSPILALNNLRNRLQ
jgi:TusA-related sulfurtransferase